MTITEHIAAVRREMAEAARESGRSERDIILVGASKMNDAAACQEAIAAGVDALGENRVQEMTAKLAQNAYDGAPLHFIGHLQRNKVVNIHATTQLKVVLVKPERFENASEIADHLREKRTVVLNLEGTNKDVARRLVDFLSGVAYAGDGKIKKVSTNTYIITPYSVDLMGDLIDELENNGLYL